LTQTTATNDQREAHRNKIMIEKINIEKVLGQYVLSHEPQHEKI
jgi:hypothetical protein